MADTTSYHLWKSVYGRGAVLQSQGFVRGQVMTSYMPMLYSPSFHVFDEISPYYRFGKEDYLEVHELKNSKKVFKILWLNKKNIHKRIDATKHLNNSVDMNVDEFHKILRTEYKAVSKNHHSYIFRSEEDANNAKLWMESLLIADKLKKAK